MASILEQAKGTVHNLLRGIDKRAEYSLALADGDPPSVVLTLSLRRHTTTVTVRAEDLEAAEGDLIRRNQLRTTLKRALDRTKFRTVPLASTKMLRGDTQADGFFRSPNSGGRFRR